MSVKRGLLDKVTPIEKIKTFFQLNWWLVWIAFVALAYITHSSANRMSAENNEIKQLLKREIEGVVFVGQNGQVVFGEKSRINAASETGFKNAIKNTLLQYLVVDANRLTDGYKKIIKSVDELYNSHKPYQEFRTLYITNDTETYPKAIGFYRTMLAGVIQAIDRDTLPDQIVPRDSNIQSYIWNDETQTFDIIINVSVDSYVFNNRTTAFDKKLGTIQLRAKGYFDLAQNSIENPLGLQFFELGMTNASK